MFKFLFRRKDEAPQVIRETQRETILRALGEVNEIVAGLEPKPQVTLDPASGAITLALPEQMPDEALALPAPAATEAAAAEPEGEPTQEDKAKEPA